MQADTPSAFEEFFESLFRFFVRKPDKAAPPPIPVSLPVEESKQVVDWVKAFRARHGRDPQIPEVQAVFDLPRTTAWRRIKSA